MLGPEGATALPLRQLRQYAAAALEPVVLTAVLAGACLLLHRVLVARGAGWLFDLPSAPRDEVLPILDRFAALVAERRPA